MSSLAHQLIATREAAAQHLPPEVAATFTAQQATLAATNAPTLAIGTALPETPLLTATGSRITLEQLLDGSPAVLVFYRGGWCPYCNVALRSYEADLLPDLEALGVRLIAISPQRPDQSLSTQEKADLTFAVVSDPENTLARSLGILDDGSDEVRAAQARLGLDLAQVNDGGDYRLPMPTVAIIDSHRRVRWADVHPDYTTRTQPETIIEAVKAL
ncbi:MAG: AhpC/TSA family protein [Acidimicrobiaceae bacterium]|nr:AhpC/TSA family protein [Acidimicrobiaceae bacterium]